MRFRNKLIGVRKTREANIPQEVLDTTYSLEEVAKQTGKSKQTVTNYIKAKLLSAEKYSGQWRVPHSELEDEADAETDEAEALTENTEIVVEDEPAPKRKGRKKKSS